MALERVMGEKMRQRFFVRMRERIPADAQELAALLNHRLRSLRYQAKLLAGGDVQYAFMLGESCSEAILLYEVETHEQLDWLIKRDPHFAYTRIEVIPTILTEALVREAQDFLGEGIFNEDALANLNFPRREIEPNGEYWLAWKEVAPFSPLCPEETQNDVHRRTILAQQGHFEELEFADDNPVGRPVGILIGHCSLEEVQSHVESCDVFPDTIVTYSRLWTHKQAAERTIANLRALRRDVPAEMDKLVGEWS